MPECDAVGVNNRELTFNQPWLRYAIPSSDGQYDNCYRYAPTHSNTSGPGQCSTDMFDTSKKIACTEFVYASGERNIQTEVKNCVLCEEKKLINFKHKTHTCVRLILKCKIGSLCLTVLFSLTFTVRILINWHLLGQ